MAKPAVTISMRGPYRLADTEASRLRYPTIPYFQQAQEKQLGGIYLQVVQLLQSYRVAYVGETNATFLSRHSGGNQSWCNPPFKDTPRWQLAACEQFGEVLEVFPPLFRTGVRAYVRIDTGNLQQRCALRKEILDDSLIFFGHLPTEDIASRKSIEAAIVRHLKGNPHRKGYPPGVAEFLYNELKGLAAERFGGFVKINAPANVVVEGLEGPVTDPAM